MDMTFLDRLAIFSSYADHSIGRLLYGLALAERARTVLEIGYHLGYSASWLCGGIADSMQILAPHLFLRGFRKNKPAEPIVISVDIDPGDSGKLIRDQGFTFHRLLVGNSHDPKTVAAVAMAFGRPIDLFFIDGDHGTAYEDWLAYQPYLDPEALVVCHDAWYPPVREALARTGLQFVDLAGHGRLAVARMRTS